VVFFAICVATGVWTPIHFYTARNDVFQQKLNAYGRLTAARAALVIGVASIRHPCNPEYEQIEVGE
jgi:hypothetical protein